MCQNVFNEVLLVSFRFQAKIPSRSGVCFQGDWQKYTPPSPPLSKEEGLKDNGNSMSIGNLIFGHNSVTVSYLIYCHSLLQNATDIVIKLQDTKKFITKCKMCQVSFITKCDSYYKMRRLLQIATVQRFKALY